MVYWRTLIHINRSVVNVYGKNFIDLYEEDSVLGTNHLGKVVHS